VGELPLSVWIVEDVSGGRHSVDCLRNLLSQVGILAETSSHNEVLVIIMLVGVAQYGLCRHFTHRHILRWGDGDFIHLHFNQAYDLSHDRVKDRSKFTPEFTVSMMYVCCSP
jgi:hypothetical protein